jgi:1-acyl-sn-glycerol-3-phosphate acyltransferase
MSEAQPSTRRRHEQSRSATIRRRFRTVPLVFAAFVVVTILSPAVYLVALVVDLARLATGGPRFVSVRLAAFAWVFLASQVAGVLALTAIWLGAGFGRSHERLVRQTYGVQRRWTATLWWAVRRLFGLGLSVEGADAAAGGPVLVMIRHASIVDNLIPANLITRPHGLKLRYVIKRELLSDPCLDIAGSRLPNAFVARETGDGREIEAVHALGGALAADEGLLIYPEGSRFSAERLARACEKLTAAGYPELAERGRRLGHLLPPRLGGPLALLESTPGADVVVCGHVGLDGFSHLSDIWAGGLSGRTIFVRMERFARAGVPGDRQGRIDWLYDRWADMDAWIDASLASEPAA